MEKSTKTFEQVVEFSNLGYMFLSKAEGETKLTYAIKKLIGDPKTGQKGSLAKVIKAQQSKARDLAIDFASTDEKGILLVDERGKYRYTKENQKAYEKAMEDLEQSALEIEPYFATEVTEELTEQQKEVFKGFVIN